MIIDTSLVKTQPRRFAGQEPESILELDRDPQCVPTGPLRYDLHAERLDRELLVRGVLTLGVRMLCARCGDVFPQDLRVPDFLRSIPLTAEYESIDLTADLREDMLLALPPNWVCSETCRGVCSRCGANRNRQACACGADEKPSAWNALNQLPL